MKVLNFHKDDIDCAPFNGSAGGGGEGQRTFQRGGALGSRKCEKPGNRTWFQLVLQY